MIHERRTALEWSVKYFTGGLKPVSQRDNLTLSLDGNLWNLAVLNTFYQNYDA